ncbi:MAG: immune inhibitor A [Thermoflexales bacterium]|nr:immune inhibitor A [Thermoflexales bacterium]
MKNKLFNVLMIVALLSSMVVVPALAAPPAPGDEAAGVTHKDIDQPNPKDYARIQERQRLLEAGQVAEAAALAQTGTDRVLVILVEFDGTDTFTWNVGDHWDPYGIVDTAGDTGTVGDCSNIITQTKTFTYTGPLHNMIARPISSTHRSADTIWTPDFDPQWFEDFMFGNGVVIDYTRQDNSAVHYSFEGQSVTDYYLDMSDGIYTITGDVIGWVSVPHSTWYYDADQCPGARSTDASVPRGAIPGAGNARQLVRDALDSVNAISNTIPGFDWKNYDLDGDGIIDRLWIVHAGYGEEDGGELLNANPVDPTDPTRTTPAPEAFYGESAVWSHSSAVTPPYSVTADVAAGAYIVMPENGGIGVFAHEYGHNLGADDLYAYGAGNTSTGFWSLMSDDWTGAPIGFEPPAVDPWHLDNWGWLNPIVLTDTSKTYQFSLGQASRFPGGAGVYRGAKIELPDGKLDLPVPIWQGSHYWWSGKADLANGRMSSVAPAGPLPAGAQLSFDLVYDIEEEWDFLWVQISTDNGTTWKTLTNTNTKCAHDASWIGGEYGFPDDLCAAGLGGFSGYNANWPDPETQTFDLSAYAGQSGLLRFWYMTDWATTYSGAFIDNVALTAGGVNIFGDNAETNTGAWAYEAPWVRSDGLQSFTHNFYLQWRNVDPETGGYDGALGETSWRFGPANSGLLVWYNNNFYSDNEIENYLFDEPSFGPKGRMLVVDAHPEPYRDPDLVALGYDNEGGNLTGRGQMRDAPFTLQDSVAFTHTDPYRAGAKEHAYEGRPAVSTFSDAQGYYPGAEYVHRGPYYTNPATAWKWVTTQWDASVVLPAKASYPLKAPGYTGNQEFRFECEPYLDGPYTGALGCYWLGANTGLGYNGGQGNPAEGGGQYGWVVRLTGAAAQSGNAVTAAMIEVFNQQVSIVSSGTSSVIAQGPEVYTVTYQTVIENAGAHVANNIAITYTLADGLQLVSSQSSAGTLMLMPGTTYQWTAAQMYPGERYTLTVVATGTHALPLVNGTLTTRIDAFDGASATSASVSTVVTAPTVRFVSPAANQVFRAFTATVPIQIATTNLAIPANGQWNLWIDGVMVGSLVTTTTSAQLGLGAHAISAELSSPAGVVLGPRATVNITVATYDLFLPLIMKAF